MVVFGAFQLVSKQCNDSSVRMSLYSAKEFLEHPSHSSLFP